MKKLLTTATIMAALTMPVFAEGELTGTEAAGEANASLKLSAQEPQGFLIGQSAMAQGTLPRSGSASAVRIRSLESEKSSGSGFVAASSGMDGGNRR